MCFECDMQYQHPITTLIYIPRGINVQLSFHRNLAFLSDVTSTFAFTCPRKIVRGCLWWGPREREREKHYSCPAFQVRLGLQSPGIKLGQFVLSRRQVKIEFGPTLYKIYTIFYLTSCSYTRVATSTLIFPLLFLPLFLLFNQLDVPSTTCYKSVHCTGLKG